MDCISKNICREGFTRINLRALVEKVIKLGMDRMSYFERKKSSNHIWRTYYIEIKFIGNKNLDKCSRGMETKTQKKSQYN